MLDDKCCGTCKYHYHKNIGDGWECVNDRSEYFADWTEYSDSCDEWEERKQMKYKVGDRIKIIKATSGCYGANEKIGTVTNKPSTDGLCNDQDGFNVDCGKGHIWRIGFASECELLDELTAEEAIRLKCEMCGNGNYCFECKFSPDNNTEGIHCDEFLAKHPEQFVEFIKQRKKDREKK